jgi:hypothetical protein
LLGTGSGVYYHSAGWEKVDAGTCLATSLRVPRGRRNDCATCLPACWPDLTGPDTVYPTSPALTFNVHVP